MSGGLRFAIPVVLFAATLQGQDWKISVVDQLGGNKYSSLRLDSDGNAHVAYFDELQNIVKYGFWDRKLDKWFSTDLDKSGGFCSLTLDSKKRPHISYLEYGPGD